MLAALPQSALADWTLGADANVRHDDNVGNAQARTDRTADTEIGARLSVFQLFPLSDGYSMTLGADLSGETFHRIAGLDNGSLESVLALKKKFGLGALAPWVRAGVSAGRSSYGDTYRNAWIYRATLAAGRRIDERWNLWADYAFERRAARAQPEEVPGLSGDAYSETSQKISLNLEYAPLQDSSIAFAVIARHGDVVSTTAPAANIFYAAKALAEDPAFGPDFYAYKLIGTTYGIRAGIGYAPTAHSLIGAAFERFDTRAEGGNTYTKSISEITWTYSF